VFWQKSGNVDIPHGDCLAREGIRVGKLQDALGLVRAQPACHFG